MELVEAIYRRRLQKRRDLRELRETARKLRSLQAEFAPKRKRMQEIEWAGRRMDGPTGFMMVRPKWSY